MEAMDTEAGTTDGIVATLYPAQHRLVHLDLKGAPPKISYYEQLFPLLSKWGATGLLLEYEDMFPYWGQYQDIAASNAYSKDDLTMLKALAVENNLIIIPLVQTFGHFEFVLKHTRFEGLREIHESPMALCPLNKDSLPTVCGMIDQVLNLHSDVKWFHIGADEVFHIGYCRKCRKHLEKSGETKTQMFFLFVQKVLEYMQKKYPGIRPIMWDDMYRESSIEALRGSGITKLVDPMVWVYGKTFRLPADLWERYGAVFDSVWAASAFKGATGPCMLATDIGYHVENQREWLKVVRNSVIPNCPSFQGYCITGWQRYDHYGILCELLPVGLPSLAICLLTIAQGSFTEKLHAEASHDLQCQQLIQLNPFKNVVSPCVFPGADIYNGVQLLLLLNTDYKTYTKNDRINGWMNAYHIRHRYANPVHIKHFLPDVKVLLERYQQLCGDMRVALSSVFYTDTVDEWICCHFQNNMQNLSKTIQDAEMLLACGAKPKDASSLGSSE